MAIEHGDLELAPSPVRAVFDANIYVAAYLSKNPRSPNKELSVVGAPENSHFWSRKRSSKK